MTVSDKGTGQGSVISPLLANIYLHYTFDLWAERWRRREASEWLLCGTWEPIASMPRENSEWPTHEGQSTDAGRRDGRVRSSDEAW